MKYQDNDFDEIDEMLFKYFKENKEVPQKTQNIIKNMNYNGKRNNFGIRKIAITILAITTLTTGGVFAQNIVSFFKNIFSLSSININNDSVVDAIEKENYIQLQALSVSYDFRSAKLKEWGIQRLKISAIGNDVFTSSTVRMERGTSYPFARTFSLAAQITF